MNEYSISVHTYILPLCTEVRTTVGLCVCDMTNIVHSGLGGVGWVSVYGSDTIGPVGRSQRSRHEPA